MKNYNMLLVRISKKTIQKTSFFVGIALLSIQMACSNQPNEQDQAEQEEKFCLNETLKKTTNIISVQSQPITEQLLLSGKIEYNENDLVAFKSLLDGVVESVNFELGDQVQKGRVLATIKSTQIQELHQQQRAQQSQITLLKKQLETKKELLADGMVSAPEVLETEQALEGAKIELERVYQSLQLYKAVGNGAFQIIAPKNGYIIQKAISSGQSITADSDALFSISNLKQVWVMVNIYASNLRYVHVGDQVKVRTVAYPDQTYTGRIDKIYNVFDDNEHVLKARVVLENQNLNLMPGLSADIIIDKKNELGNTVAIPNNAVVFSNNKEHIVVYKDDCTMETRRITIVGRNEEYTFIQEPISADEKVITTNALLIFEQLNQ